MVQQLSEPGYSLLWASGIVAEFSEKYVRATEAVKRFYQITDENVIWWVANRQERWQNYKNIVKQLERWARKQDDVGESPLLLDRCVVDARDRAMKYRNASVCVGKKGVDRVP